MFWGSFSRSLKGPGIFWEKDWNSILSQSYQDHTVPIIHGWLRMNPGLILVQDDALGLSTKETKVDLNERSTYLIIWPAFSPDLNLIEIVWDRMKDYIKRHYPEYLSDFGGEIEESCLLVCHFYLPEKKTSILWWGGYHPLAWTN